MSLRDELITVAERHRMTMVDFDEARRERTALVVRARATGMTLQDIGDAIGVSKGRVQQMLYQENARQKARHRPGRPGGRIT